MKRIFLFILLALGLYALDAAFGATKYVAPGASGNGASWSTPGPITLINNSAAGDIIYLAGGSYGNGFAVTASGSSTAPITVKRATAADHGSDTGWNANMDTQAVFNTGIGISGSYVVVDGNCWKPPGLPTVFGIKVNHASGTKGVDAGSSNGNITLRDLDVIGPGINSAKQEGDGVHFPSNATISGCAIHATDVLLFAWKGTSGLTLENSLLFDASSNIVFSGSPSDPHPDILYSGGMLTNSTMRWCICANVTSEGVFFDSELAGDSMEFYGDIFFQGDVQTGCVPLEWQNGGTFGKVFLRNCTFVDYNKGNYMGPGTTVASGSLIQNNLWINCAPPNFNTGMSNNGFWGTSAGSSPITGTSSPFVTSGTKVWVKGSGNPPATRVTTGAPTGYNPIGMEAAFVLADASWAKGKAITVPSGRNTDMFGNSGNNLGAIQGSGTQPGPTPTPAPTATPTPAPTATPAPTPTPPPGTAKFQPGDYVTPSSAGLNVRSSPAGPVVGQHGPGDLGLIVSGPQSAPLNGTPVAWYLINWDSAPASGHSGDDDLIKTAGPSPTPPPNPTPSPTPVTYKNWTNKLNANTSDWIGKNPPYPDGE